MNSDFCYIVLFVIFILVISEFLLEYSLPIPSPCTVWRGFISDLSTSGILNFGLDKAAA